MGKRRYEKITFTGILLKINKSSCIIGFNNTESQFVNRYKDVKDNKATFISRKYPIKFHNTKVGDEILLKCHKKFRNGRLSIVPIELKKINNEEK